MHAHLEIIMPPVEDVKSAVEQIMKPFDESHEEDGERNSNGFWDFYVIGGRWAGHKLLCDLPEDRLEAFYDALKVNNITVSCVTAGKQTISPATQIPTVDAIWHDHFPDHPLKICPLFSHFSDQYKHNTSFPDIMKLSESPKSLKASTVIIAGESWNDETKLEAKYLLHDSIWNGITHQDTKWDGSVESAIAEYKDRLKNAKPEYAAKNIPNDEWLVVTVDYHS